MLLPRRGEMSLALIILSLDFVATLCDSLMRRKSPCRSRGRDERRSADLPEGEQDAFDDRLAAAERMELEGVVSKCRDAPYRSGARCGWIKTKTNTWREANKDRWRLFERQRGYKAPTLSAASIAALRREAP